MKAVIWNSPDVNLKVFFNGSEIGKLLVAPSPDRETVTWDISKYLITGINTVVVQATSVGDDRKPSGGNAKLIYIRIDNAPIPTPTPTQVPPTPTPTPTATPTPEPYTEVGGMLNGDRTWGLADSPYLVTETVQVPDDVTLTIEAGVEVNKPDSVSSMFRVHGTLISQGTQSDAVSFKGSSSGLFVNLNGSLSGLIDIRFSRIEDFGGLSNNQGSATINVRDSVLLNISGRSGTSQSELLFERNRFENAAGFYISNLFNKVSFRLNCFVNKKSSDAWFMVMHPLYGDGSTQEAVVIENNAFLDTGEVVFKAYIMMNADLPRLEEFPMGPNYYGTTDSNILDQMVYDRSDNLDLGFKIKLTDPLNTSPVEGCP
jgi:hypothetical protein